MISAAGILILASAGAGSVPKQVGGKIAILMSLLLWLILEMTDIFCIGYPKVGTTWLCRLLGDALNSPVGAAHRPDSHQAIATEGKDRPGDYYIAHGHLVPISDPADKRLIIPQPKKPMLINLANLADEKIVVIFRDPRDVVVSANHHWDIGSIHKTIEKMAHGRWPITHGGGLVKFYRAWMELETVYKSVTSIRYEWLSSSTPLYELIKIYEHIANTDIFEDALKGNFDTKDFTDAITRQSFTARRQWTEQHGETLNYGKDFQLRFLRKGVVGDWINHFDQRAIDMCQEHFGEIMEGMGYE